MTLFVLLAVLLTSAGNAFARASLEPENRVWEIFPDPNIRTTEIGLRPRKSIGQMKVTATKPRWVCQMVQTSTLM